MSLTKSPKQYRFPVTIISQAVWLYHRFNHSLRDVQEQIHFRRVEVSHETIRNWCIKFGSLFKDVIKKKERKVSNKWHLDEMMVTINGERQILWRAVDEFS